MSQLKTPLRTSRAYERDFHAWTAEQARELRRAKPDRLDWKNRAEEVERLGRSDKRAIGSDLKIVVEHLIMWKFPPERRSDSWSDSIEAHRDRIARIIKDSPGLAATPGKILTGENRKALRDLKPPQARIPVACPFTVEETPDPDFLPDADKG
jgi:hypothetical protein